MCESAARPDFLAHTGREQRVRGRADSARAAAAVAPAQQALRGPWVLPFARNRGLVGSLGLVAVLLSLLCGTRARADGHDDQIARAHFIAGEAYFAQARFPEAAREFEEAYKASNRPEMLINLARAQERAGSLTEAIAALDLLLSRRADMVLRRDAETTLARLREQQRELTRQHQVELAVSGPPEDHSTDLAPRTAARASTAGVPTPVRVAEPGGEAAHERRAAVRWPTLAVAGGALASALTAVVTGLVAHAKYTDLEKRCPEGACTAQWTHDRALGQRMARTSSALTASAVVLGGAAATLWIFDLRRPDLRSRASEDRASTRGQARLGVRTSETAHEATFRFDF